MNKAKTCLDCEWHVRMGEPTSGNPTRLMIEHAITTGHDLTTVE